MSDLPTFVADLVEREMMLRVCRAYGGDPDDPIWHSAEGVASIIENLSGQIRAAARESRLEAGQAPQSAPQQDSP